MVTEKKTEIIAVDSENPKFLIHEDMTDKEDPNCFGAHEGKINTLAVTSDRQSLLAGDNKGVVVQYSLKGQFGNIEQNYGHLGIRRIFTSATFGNIIVLGGDNFKIRVLDLARKKQVDLPVTTAVRFITSAQICRVKDSMVVALVGRKLEESTGGSDLMDITDMYREQDWQDWEAEESESDDSRVWDLELRELSHSGQEEEDDDADSSLTRDYDR